ncbi:MAG: hybrid sensor histidine kinase/response regulator [Armatimonadetes bacterium]|nr:hybrid sensor histidine kinase/response regulator [Armatimonadota bacterium]
MEQHRPARILVVEDSPASRRVIARCLSGHQLVEAPDGETALAYLAEQTVDLVLLDIGLPGIDGYEVLRRIRSDERTRPTMVILVTARGQTGEVVKGFDYEADDYMVKPFRNEELVARVKAALRLKWLQDELRRINADLEAEVQTRTKQLLDQQQFALLGRNSAQLAHNLNSPLTALLGYVELALSVRPEKREELLERCRDVAIEMKNIISKLLTGVRSRKALLDESTPLELNSLVTDMVSFWQVNTQFRYKTVVAVDLADHLPTVMAVRSDVQQILTNLVDNAMYALREHPDAQLTLATRLAGDEVRLEVTDNGSGIAPEHLQRVFEPTFTTKPVGEGTGLGLASCYELAVAHGGRMEMESVVGQGTTVALILPRACAQAVESAA